MAESKQPIYVKKKHRKRQRPERLHGAFSGGFSAGHFNTVGSKFGWKPSNFEEIEEAEEKEGGNNSLGLLSNALPSASIVPRKRRLMQRPEDFMDEEDANEWGGPMKVNQSYQRHDSKHNDDIHNSADGDKAIKDSSSLRRLLYVKKDSSGPKRDSVGKQLLKVLGWREHVKTNVKDSKSYAYVTLDVDEKPMDQSLLSSKRLKRIEMQLSSRKYEVIPMPKTDTYGMGYEPFLDAPEFKAHREMRKQRAQQRARAAASSTGDKRMNVYNMNELNEDFDDDESPVTKVSPKKTNHDNVLAYETMEDFIGTKTVSGFALHDDDDHVYDNSVGQSASLFNKGEKSKIDMNDYHNEAYEGSDSDVEKGDFLSNHLDQNSNKSQSIHQKQNETKFKINAFAGALNAWASDGKKNVEIKAVTSDGEVLLEGFDLGGSNSDTIKRYLGPDVPANYVVKRHQFSHEDAISTLKELSSIKRREIESKHVKKETSSESITGKAFASLSSSLKNRFTKSSENEDKISNSKTRVDPRNVSVKRTKMSWQPSHFLLKRFNVNTIFPKNVRSTQNQNTSTVELSREEVFFQKDVLGQLKLPTNTYGDQSSSSQNQTLSEEKYEIERPSFELMKSIFEPSSDEEDPEVEPANDLINQQDNEERNFSISIRKHSCHDVKDSLNNSVSKKRRKKSSSKREKKKSSHKHKDRKSNRDD